MSKSKSRKSPDKHTCNFDTDFTFKFNHHIFYSFNKILLHDARSHQGNTLVHNKVRFWTNII